MDWPVGTNRFDIWHWFDDRYDGGVHTLMEDMEGYYRDGKGVIPEQNL